jgi:DNA-binding NtrC family response regulator
MASPERPRILVVDDEANICRSVEKILSRADMDVVSVLNGYDALARAQTDHFDLVLTDLKMSSLGGMELVRRITEQYPDVAVLVMTGYASVASAVEVMKLGALDYLPKPFTPEELRAVVRQALEKRGDRIENRRLREEARAAKPVFHQLIGNSPKIRNVISMVQKVAPTDSTVLLYGESGTGKELVARAIHANSPRQGEVFFAVDCGTLSSNLLESELFGHVKGAFTGAHQDKEGIFKLAHRGTIFLDEISNISVDIQGKLLRFLESREFLQVGGTSVQKVDIRLILATNRNLKDMVAGGVFREDFYYRIYVYPIILPPLRERREDILPIAYHFLQHHSQKMNKEIRGIDERAVQRLTDYDWPGNVRQLRNALERAVILCDSNQIRLEDLPMLSESGDLATLMDHIPLTNTELKELKKQVRQKAADSVEKAFMRNALAQNDWNISRTAQAIGMQRTNLQSLMKKHNIVRPGRAKKREIRTE